MSATFNLDNANLFSPMFFDVVKISTISPRCECKDIPTAIDREDTFHGCSIGLCTVFAENTLLRGTGKECREVGDRREKRRNENIARLRNWWRDERCDK